MIVRDFLLPAISFDRENVIPGYVLLAGDSIQFRVNQRQLLLPTGDPNWDVLAQLGTYVDKFDPAQGVMVLWEEKPMDKKWLFRPFLISKFWQPPHDLRVLWRGYSIFFYRTAQVRPRRLTRADREALARQGWRV